MLPAPTNTLRSFAASVLMGLADVMLRLRPLVAPRALPALDDDRLDEAHADGAAADEDPLAAEEPRPRDLGPRPRPPSARMRRFGPRVPRDAWSQRG